MLAGEASVALYKYTDYNFPLSTAGVFAFPSSGDLVTGMVFNGAGPNGESIFTLTHSSGTKATILNISTSLISNTFEIPFVTGEICLAVNKAFDHYVVHTLSPAAILSSYLVNAVNFATTVSPTKIDLKQGTDIVDYSNASVHQLISGGWYAVLFFANNVDSPPISSAWYSRLDVDAFIEWAGRLDQDLPYVDDSSTGFELPLLLSSVDTLSIGEGDTSILQVDVSAIDDLANTTTYRLYAVVYNNAGVLELVDPAITDTLVENSAASALWFARIAISGNQLILLAYGEGLANPITFEATGKLYN